MEKYENFQNLFSILITFAILKMNFFSKYYCSARHSLAPPKFTTHPPNHQVIKKVNNKTPLSYHSKK